MLLRSGSLLIVAIMMMVVGCASVSADVDSPKKVGDNLRYGSPERHAWNMSNERAVILGLFGWPMNDHCGADIGIGTLEKVGVLLFDEGGPILIAVDGSREKETGELNNAGFLSVSFRLSSSDEAVADNVPEIYKVESAITEYYVDIAGAELEQFLGAEFLSAVNEKAFTQYVKSRGTHEPRYHVITESRCVFGGYSRQLSDPGYLSDFRAILPLLTAAEEAVPMISAKIRSVEQKILQSKRNGE